MILITGGAGFVGQHLCSYLAVLGVPHIRVLSRNAERVFDGTPKTLAVAVQTVERMAQAGLLSADHLSASQARAERGAELLREVINPVSGDVSDVANLEDAMRDVDAVVHTVAIIRETEGRTFFGTNVRGTENVVAAMNRTGVKRIVSMGVLGAAADRSLPYSHSRWQAEAVVESSGLDHSIVKPSLVLGHGDTFSRRVVRALDFSKPLVVLPNGGKTQFQPLWIGDLMRIIATCLEEPKTMGNSYEVGGPERVSFGEIARQFGQALRKRRIFVSVPSSFLVPGAVAMGRIFRDPPVTRTELRELDHDNVTSEDSVQRAFGFTPAALSEYLEAYLRSMLGR